MNKIIIIVIVVAVIIILAGYFFLSNQQTTLQPPVLEQPSSEIIPQPSEESKEEAATLKENTVIYTDAGYPPANLLIKKGDTVTFKNQSSSSMWPASAIHPTHRVYDGASLDQHCPDTSNSAFDACTGILPGGSWSFKFDKTGSWKYHDHLNPQNLGTIIVE